MTARFSSQSDPSGYSVQSSQTTFLTLTQFSRNYLFDNDPFLNPLRMDFDRPLTGISLTFATSDNHGPGNVEVPSEVKLTAYLSSADASPVGSATSRGTFSEESLPQGTLSFNSGPQTFDSVVIEIVLQQRGGTSLLADNVTVTTAP